MSKQSENWYSERLGQHVTVVRWGHVGTPVLVFPTAAGDAEECERFLMLDVLAPLLEAGRIKVYSVDSVAGQAWIDRDVPRDVAGRRQNQFDEFVYREVLPLIRADCKSPDVEVIAAGASIGAFNALAAICRHPDVFSKAICMSGTFDIERLFCDGEVSRDLWHASPLHFMPRMPPGEHLEKLKSRFILMAHGQGRAESPEHNWRMADLLGGKGIPNRVDDWGPDYPHDWVTWRKMLPKYLDELVPRA